MNLETETQLRHLARTLAPKQQTLDFANAELWQQLPAVHREACREALAALLYQVATTTPANEIHPHKENDSHER
jgi:hypothetical protein